MFFNWHIFICFLIVGFFLTDDDAEDGIPTVKVGNEEITLTDVNEEIINQMTAEEKDIYTQKFQDYYAFMNDWSK